MFGLGLTIAFDRPLTDGPVVSSLTSKFDRGLTGGMASGSVIQPAFKGRRWSSGFLGCRAHHWEKPLLSLLVVDHACCLTINPACCTQAGMMSVASAKDGMKTPSLAFLQWQCMHQGIQ